MRKFRQGTALRNQGAAQHARLPTLRREDLRLPDPRYANARADAHQRTERRCVAQCFRELHAAEAALARARCALEEIQPDQVYLDDVHIEEGGPQDAKTSSDGGDDAAATPASAPVPQRASTRALDGRRTQRGRTWSPKASSPMVEPSPTELSFLRTWATVQPGDLNPSLIDQVVLKSQQGEVATQSNKLYDMVVKESTRVTPRSEDGPVRLFVGLDVEKDVALRPAFGGRLRVPILHPEAKFRVLWMIVGVLFIVYEAYSVPVFISFDVQASGSLFAWASVVDAYFILDICLSCFCGYITNQGVVVLDPDKILQRYVKTWLPFDLVAAIPWEWILAGGSVGSEKVTRTVKAFRVARLLQHMRLSRVVKVGMLMDKIEARLEANHVYVFVFGIARISFLLLIVCHWSACVWYAIGTMDEERTWISAKSDQVTDDRLLRYTYALYFTVTTMTTVGYGDITPQNFNEVRFVIVLLFISSVLFGSLMGTLVDMLGAFNKRRNLLAEQKALLGQYMRWRAVPWKLTMKVRTHLVFMWDTNAGYDHYEEDLKAQLPPVLKAELCYHIFGRALASAPFLAWMRDHAACIKHLAELVGSVFLERGDFVFRLGQPNERVFLLLSGVVMLSQTEHLKEETGDRHGPRPTWDDDVIPRRQVSRVGDIINLMMIDRQRAAPRILRMRTSAADPLRSDVLREAVTELRVIDAQREAAAKRVQRRWRANHPQWTRRSSTGSHSVLRAVYKKEVQAPAYFGESCLWQPLEEWDNAPPPLYLYSACSRMRSEVLYIPRQAIHDVLSRYSPWLPERFELFRATVHERLEAVMASAAFQGRKPKSTDRTPEVRASAPVELDTVADERTGPLGEPGSPRAELLTL